jgi:hypothetical protein
MPSSFFSVPIEKASLSIQAIPLAQISRYNRAIRVSLR